MKRSRSLRGKASAEVVYLVDGVGVSSKDLHKEAPGWSGRTVEHRAGGVESSIDVDLSQEVVLPASLKGGIIVDGREVQQVL